MPAPLAQGTPQSYTRAGSLSSNRGNCPLLLCRKRQKVTLEHLCLAIEESPELLSIACY